MAIPSKDWYYNSEWFGLLLDISFRRFTAYSIAVTTHDIEALCQSENIEVPHNVKYEDLVETINWRIKNRRASLMPLFHSHKAPDTLRLSDYQKFLNELYKGNGAKRRVLLNALSKSFIPYLKQKFSADSKAGVRNLSNPWSLRLIFFNDQFFASFKESCNQSLLMQRYYHEIENLRGLLSSTTPSSYFSRKKKFPTGSNEIESILREYLKIPAVYSSARTAVSETRKLIHLAGIQSLEELLSTDGQNRIIALEYNGQIGQYAMSRPRACLRWIFDKYNCPYPPYFSNLSEQSIFDLSLAPEIERIISEAWSKLDEYEETNLHKLKVFFRLLLRTTNAVTAKKFYSIKPSDWIRTLLEAEAKNNHLQSFRAIKMFRKAFFQRLPRDKQWPEKGSQNYQAFLQAVQSDPFFRSTGIGSTLRLSDFEVVFSKNAVHWGRFFDLLQDLYYRVADADSEEAEKGDSFIIGSEDFQKSQSYIIEKAYGPAGKGNKNKAVQSPDGRWRSGGLLSKRNFTDEEKKELEVLMAYCLQSVAPSRFAHEASRIVFSEKVPRFVSMEGPHRLFWWPEKGCYAILFSKSRKNDISYLCPLNNVADALIGRYLKLHPRAHGKRFFKYNIQKLVDEIKRTNVIVHKPGCSFEDFQNGVRFRGVTPHSMRHMLRRYIEANYNGPDKELILTVALGHKIRDDSANRSSASGYYGDNLNYSVVVFDQLRRIKNGNVLTTDQIELRQLRDELVRSDKKTRKQIREGVEKLNEQAEMHLALGKANLVATILGSAEDIQLDFLTSLLEGNPELLIKMLIKK